MVARRVGARLGVGARGTDALEVGDAPDEYGRRVAEVLREALLNGGGDLRLALGSRREEDVAGLDVGRDSRVAEHIERGPQLVHGEASVAGDVDAPEQARRSEASAQPTGTWAPVRAPAGRRGRRPKRLSSTSGRRSLGQVGQELAEQRAELERVPAGAAADDDPPDPIQDEVGVGGVVVDAALRGDRPRVERGEEACHRAGQWREKRRVVGHEREGIRRIEGAQARARGRAGPPCTCPRAGPPPGTGKP